MEDATTWKGHSLTLIVFTGIVLLCSIFFILGMLVGRAQGGRAAQAEPVQAAVETKPPEIDSSYFDTVEEKRPPALETAPSKPDPAQKLDKPAPSKKVNAGSAVSVQVAALGDLKAAQRLVKELKGRGFQNAFLVAPAAKTANAVYRIQVGPYANVAEAESAKRRLESSGYKAMLKK